MTVKEKNTSPARVETRREIGTVTGENGRGETGIVVKGETEIEVIGRAGRERRRKTEERERAEVTETRTGKRREINQRYTSSHCLSSVIL